MTEEEVEIIRILYRDGANQKYIADLYGISQGTVSDIVIGRTWKEAPGPIKNQDYEGKHQKENSLTPSEVREIRKKYTEGLSTVQLAEKYGLHKPHVVSIINGNMWEDAGGPIKGEDHHIDYNSEEI